MADICKIDPNGANEVGSNSSKSQTPTSKICRNNICCLNMFERAVQDPCCQACDMEDENNSEDLFQNYTAIRELERSDKSLSPLNETFYQTDEVDPLEENGRGAGKSTDLPSNIMQLNDPLRQQPSRHHRRAATLSTSKYTIHNENGNDNDNNDTNPLFLKQRMKPQDLRKIKTAPYFDTGCMSELPNKPNYQINSSPFFLRNSRRNSCNLIHQMSRKPTQSEPRPYSSMSANARQENNKIDTFSDYIADSPNGQRSLSQVSCAAIPTHLYGLEKYVTSELDAMSSTDEYKIESKCEDAEQVRGTSVSSSQLMTGNEPLTMNVRRRSSNNKGGSISNPRHRKKSFIEASLGSSFSST
ncbi:hypothetical protein NCAS_0A05330 [Naumovozyma castellii]|uniref:Uncharacterized protein n=1 Tax=Naumovozyma castellii TaxID=27288 RepID=G0V6J6_NAUCA|nr:hypothetical protein NCAS_0A05330 [Naumovozyma castellii CBS 4309]CCC67091.1 hypothetical protein NCAS_0A05330 [Naumovozyma castellii CBS 4309]